MTTATYTPVDWSQTILCPHCTQAILTTGKDIHYCVEYQKIGRRRQRVCHEHVAYYDGREIGAGYHTHHDAEVALDQHVYDLQHSGLMRTATELDGGSPDWVTPTCPTCAGDTPCVDCSPVVDIPSVLEVEEPDDEGPSEEETDYSPLGACAVCGEDAWLPSSIGLLCPEHELIDPDDPRCPNCGDEHHVQRCPQVGALLMSDPYVPNELPIIRGAFRTAMANGHYITANALADHAACLAQEFVTGANEPIGAVVQVASPALVEA